MHWSCFSSCWRREKECGKLLHGYEMIRLHGHSWGTLICLRLHYAWVTGDQVFFPHINAPCFTLTACAWVGILILNWAFAILYLLYLCLCSEGRWTEKSNNLLRMNTIKFIHVPQYYTPFIFSISSLDAIALFIKAAYCLAVCSICSTIIPKERQMCDSSWCSIFGCVSPFQLSNTEQSRIYFKSYSSSHAGWLGKVNRWGP